MAMTVFEEIIDKHDLRAVSGVDRAWLTFPMEGMVPMGLTEEKDRIIARYHTEDMLPLSEINEWPYERRLKVMIGISSLSVLTERYAFSLEPENVMTDALERSYILHRDILPAESSGETRFLAEYKALALSALDSDYSFRDYMADFTEHLSKKKPVMARVAAGRSPDEIRDILIEERNSYLQIIAKDYVHIEGKRYGWQKRYMIFSICALLAAGMIIAFLVFKELPYLRAGKALGEYYLLKDYEHCVTAMAKISVSDMNTAESYMLAQAYVRLEDLSKEQRDNIIDTLSVKDSELRAGYWIHTGRHENIEALDIARRLTDPELELYSYLKMAKAIENDTSLTGQEKHDQAESVKNEIDKLQKTLEIVDDE